MRFIFYYICVFIPLVGNAGKMQHYLRAEAYFKTRQYALACKYYELAMKKDSSLMILRNLSNCYLKLNDFNKAEKCLKTATKKDSLNYKIWEEYANVLKINEKHILAKNAYFKLSKLVPAKKAFYESKQAFCDSVSIWRQGKSTYTVQNITSINTEYSEISPTLNNDNLVFASNREGVIILPKAPENDLPYFDLYKCKIKSEGNLGEPMPLSEFINSIDHETSASFNKEGTSVYFTQCKNKTQIQGDSMNRPKLFKSEKTGSIWGKPHTFIFNDSAYAFSQPCIDNDEKMFFFASDIKGGYGGSDIYISLNIKDKWTDPINLGPIVNTPGNEIYPFYDSTGTLYFASDYHMGVGGFDIFRATQEKGDFVKVENLKYPINSPANDFGLFFDSKRNQGYFSSDRPGGKGREDIYFFKKEDDLQSKK